MTITVTGLSETDRSRWTVLWRSYLEFYETTLPDAVYDHTWARMMAGTELHGLAARSTNEIVGITHYLYHAHSWSLHPACYLQDLYVDAGARGTGAGRALIGAVADKATAAGATRLYWTTQETNAVARGLYDRIAKYRGFIKYDYPPLAADQALG